MINKTFCFLLWITLIALTGCAQATQSNLSRQQLNDFCSRHHNLPICPNFERAYTTESPGLNQITMISKDDFQAINAWCVGTFTSKQWSGWTLSKNMDSGHPDSEFYDLDRGSEEISIYIHKENAHTSINYVVSEGKWEKSNYVPVKTTNSH